MNEKNNPRMNEKNNPRKPWPKPPKIAQNIAQNRPKPQNRAQNRPKPPYLPKPTTFRRWVILVDPPNTHGKKAKPDQPTFQKCLRSAIAFARRRIVIHQARGVVNHRNRSTRRFCGSPHLACQNPKTPKHQNNDKRSVRSSSSVSSPHLACQNPKTTNERQTISPKSSVKRQFKTVRLSQNGTKNGQTISQKFVKRQFKPVRLSQNVVQKAL